MFFLLGQTLNTSYRDTLKTVYESLVVPHFNYNVVSWFYQTNTLSKLQKKGNQNDFPSKYHQFKDETYNEISQPTQN